MFVLSEWLAKVYFLEFRARAAPLFIKVARELLLPFGVVDKIIKLS